MLWRSDADMLFRDLLVRVSVRRERTDGWRVVAVSPNIAMSHGLVVTFERQK